MSGCSAKLFGKVTITLAVIAVLTLIPASLFAQDIETPERTVPPKHALVIGNSAYTDLTPLANPLNDASDITEVLEWLGFETETVLNGSLEQMEDALIRLKDRLSESKDAYGFFFYAGHGVQSGGENYLVPVNAVIPSESNLRNRALSVQALLDDLNEAGNGLNVIILDACRDNPFGWSRSGTRGLAMVSRQPADSIIVYATSSGQRASDGDGRNGLFTSQLLNNLLTHGLEVNEVFRRTGQDVAEVSNRQQIPAIYSQFFGVAYLGEWPDGADFTGGSRPQFMPFPGRMPETTVIDSAKFWSIGVSAGTSFSEPWVTGTVKGTIAPFKHQYFEVGLNVGIVSTRNQVTSYYSLTPYLNYSFFWPFNKTAAVHAGLGVGYMISRYEYYRQDIYIQSMPADASAGILLFNFLDISYTMSFPIWTISSSTTPAGKALLSNVSNRLGNKLTVGYCYRF